MKKKSILITGGAGFIGSHVNEMLNLAGYDTVVLDNLSLGSQKAVHQGTFIEGDISDSGLLNQLFSTYSFQAVMHFAAFTDVGESCVDPIKYYQNNVAATIKLLDAMDKHSVKTFIFSSSAAVYGLPQEDSITESHPCQPINPYGHTKLMIETILQDVAKARGICYTCLRYFNAAGGDPRGKIKNYKTKESNLIPLILRSLIQPGGKIFINGTDYNTPDGTCIRDYIHIEDLGTAHIQAMERLFAGGNSQCYNLGNGKGFSIREVISATEKVTDLKVNAIEGPRRPGDPPILVAHAAKAHKELNWHPQYGSLEKMIADAWIARHPLS